MKNLILPSLTSFELKRIGFEEEVLGVYEVIIKGDPLESARFRYNWDYEGVLYNHNKIKKDFKDQSWFCSAPTVDVVLLWFEHKGFISEFIHNEDGWMYKIKQGDSIYYPNSFFSDSIECKKESINKLIELYSEILNRFATWEISKKLKELGYKRKSLARWIFHNELEWQHPEYEFDSIPDDKDCSLAPLWQDVLDWLRVEKGVNTYLIPHSDNPDLWLGKSFSKKNKKSIVNIKEGLEYYKCLEILIKMTLELI
jgi:hypothetical protein